MEQYVGIDVSLEESSVCVMDRTGQILRETKVASDPEALLNFLGRLDHPVTLLGMAARLSLVLAHLEWAAGERPEPHEITVREFGRAAHLVEAYFLPMARRAYADAATPKVDRAARRLVGIIREQGWQSFTARQVMKLDRAGLSSKAELDPALAALEDGECIRPVEAPTRPQGGRPQRLYAVNPALHRVRP